MTTSRFRHPEVP